MVATRALEAHYLSAFGEPPRGARAWRDGSNLLLVLRPGADQEAGLDCSALPARIAESVRMRTGCELHGGRWRSEPELGIEMFVFSLPAPETVEAVLSLGAPAAAGWSPVPSEGPVTAGRRR